MADSLRRKRTAILNAIAITTALAIISGQLTPNALANLQNLLSLATNHSQVSPH
jgi:translation initiation factor 6 (eIF-6)